MESAFAGRTEQVQTSGRDDAGGPEVLDGLAQVADMDAAPAIAHQVQAVGVDGGRPVVDGRKIDAQAEGLAGLQDAGAGAAGAAEEIHHLNCGVRSADCGLPRAVFFSECDHDLNCGFRSADCGLNWLIMVGIGLGAVAYSIAFAFAHMRAGVFGFGGADATGVPTQSARIADEQSGPIVFIGLPHLVSKKLVRVAMAFFRRLSSAKKASRLRASLQMVIMVS